MKNVRHLDKMRDGGYWGRGSRVYFGPKKKQGNRLLTHENVMKAMDSISEQGICA